MLGPAYPPGMLQAMFRPISLSVVAFACALSICPASAQMSDSDLVTRMDRLEGAIRDLTGNIEQLQYRNQQLEQQVQRLQAQIQGGAGQAGSSPQQPSPPPQRPAA
jgi:TolA-binding protein